MATESGPSSKPSGSTSRPPKSVKEGQLAQRAKGEGQRKSTKKQPPPKTAPAATSSVPPKPTDKPALERKTAFRHVLDNPLTVDWPAVPLNVENAVLSCVVQLLESVRPYHEQRDANSRKSKRAKRPPFVPKKDNRRKKKGTQPVEPPNDAPMDVSSTTATDAVTPEAGPSTLKRKRSGKDEEAEGDKDNDEEQVDEPSSPPPKRRKTSEEEPEVPAQEPVTEPAPEEPPKDVEGTTDPLPDKLQRPEMLDHLIFGLNEVTKRLESQSRALRSPQKSGAEAAPASSSNPNSNPEIAAQVAPLSSKPSIRLVLVCRTDADSPIMIAHLPTLIAACNSVPHSSDVVLVALPRSAESTLAEAAGLRRVLAMAFDDKTPGLEPLLAQFLPSIPILKAAWLAVPAITPKSAASKSAPASSAPAVAKTALVPTHIKHLKTSVPKDIKASKKKRTEERSAAKKKRDSVKAAVGIKTLPKVVISGKKKKDEAVPET